MILASVLPAAGAAQGTQADRSLAYQPTPSSAQLQKVAAQAASQDTVTVDPYRVDGTVATGAAIGGFIGGMVVAVHTLSDDNQEPLSWAAAVGIPILGGLVGAGVAYLFR